MWILCEKGYQLPPSKKYVESLQARIRHLEAQVVSLGSQPATVSDETNDSEPRKDETAGYDDKGLLSELSELVGRLNVTGDGQLHYFGSQSSYNLSHEPMYEANALGTSARVQKQGLDAAARLGKQATISNELKEHLLDLYWRWQNPWNYIIHKGAFLESFRGEGDGRYCSPLLLWSIFALSARYSDRVELRSMPDDPTTAGDTFCEHAKILLFYESEAPTITTVQAACLLALRIMSDGKEALGWLYSGNATRMAHNLGLHLDSSKWTASGLVTEQEAEGEIQTKSHVDRLNRLFATGLGRPSSNSKSSITCPKPIIDTDEEYTPWLPTTETNVVQSYLGMHSRISSTACHIAEAMSIACEAMDVIYAPNSKLSDREIENVVSKADVELRTHYRALPSYLRLPASSKVPMLPHVCLFHRGNPDQYRNGEFMLLLVNSVQADVRSESSLQYHAHLILLHRPLACRRRSRSLVGVSASNDGNSLVNDEYTNQHMATCRHSATEIAKLLRVYKQQYTLRRIPIAAVHLCFPAAIVHLIDARPSNPNRQQAIRYLQICIDSLRDLKAAWCAWSDRTLRAVRLLAREWYHCEDVSQLQHLVQAGRADDQACDTSDRIALGQVMEGKRKVEYRAEGSVLDIQGQPGFERMDPDVTEANDDSLDFLFDATSPDQYTDNLVREWLVENGY
ncbi:Nitrogen assimilation transcription factor nirA 2 [Colletotrichum chlorophyti]|uniref:Nitrogen assimilation transcription factor nirA 2 n=1 Tax=Colletotrichum chlorophyti TaxID=708187 RepID=A0A1Q8RR94_9PEZI|nr:Nitrogen assimilation transcription factor nirA 2 [Colletotrichum chlorophyti]